MSLYKHYLNNSSDKNLLQYFLYIPGLPHLLQGQQVIKGLLLFIAFLFSLISIFFFINIGFWVELWQLWCIESCQNLFKITDTVFFNKLLNISLILRLSIITVNAVLIAYLFQINKEDLQFKFQSHELDKKPSIFSGSLSFAYVQTSVLTLFILIYGIFYFTPPLVEVPLELVFTDNPNAQVAKPQKTNRLAKQNAENTGRNIKKKQLAPGRVRPNQAITPEKNKYSNNKSQKQNRQTTPFQNKRNTKPRPKSQAKPLKYPKKPTPRPTPKPKPKKPVSKKPSTTWVKPKPKYVQQTQKRPQQAQQASKPAQQSNPSPQGGRTGTYSPIYNRRPTTNNQVRGVAGSGNSAPNSKQGPGTLKARKSVNYGPYNKFLEQLIHGKWRAARNDSSPDKVLVSFKINRDGSIKANSIKVKSSNSPQATTKALKAIQDSAPFIRPLPAGAPSYINIDFSFKETGLSKL